MGKKKLRRSALSGMAAVTLTSALMGSAGVHANDAPPPLSEWEEMLRSMVYVSFEDLPVSLTAPPRLVDGVMMVQARNMLEGLGYSLQWNQGSRSITAIHKNRPGLLFTDQSLQWELGGTTPLPLQSAPFIEEGSMWIPLRAAAEAAGLHVKWDAPSRVAFVTDPQAIPRFRVMTQVPRASTALTPSVLLEHLKSEWQADVELTWVEPEHYEQKAKVMIAAGDMADLMLFPDPYFLDDELTSSFSLDLEPHLDKLDRLRKYAEDNRHTRQIDGQIYTIPRLSDPHHAAFPAVRQDWLDNLGLSAPRTMDEVYAVMKAFTEQDPDGDEKNNTRGLTGTMSGAYSLGWVEHAFTGSPERFSVQDGKLIDHAVTAQLTEALQWLAKAYADGLLDEDFAVMSAGQTEQRLTNNQAGLAAMTIDEAARLTGDKAAWLPLGTLKAASTSKPIAPWLTNGSGAYIVSAMTKDDPAELLKWLDYDIEMTLENKWSELEGWQRADQEAVDSLFGKPDMLQNNMSLEQLPTKVRDQYEAAVKEWRTISYEDSLLPEAGVLRSSWTYDELNQELMRNKVQFITGEMSLEEWNAYINKLQKSETYKAMIAELEKLLP
ncbi:stalk domain-containing protein [Paenibacillus soyae]|uniref:Extracellular solute-binding protein n=1 Tax=Paenibacillus soyae TaxID=2969249 RepID=A0A9X2MRR5_9BACL|nr:stalk domain-containing protein [Paenibacillus soyae]MCR2802767.1 extracellular solute-binding protein [Paenibacillus soyae]